MSKRIVSTYRTGFLLGCLTTAMALLALGLDWHSDSTRHSRYPITFGDVTLSV